MRVWGGGPRFTLSVTGPDAVDLLHRVTSNDVRGLPVGSSNHQCLLTAKGKIVALFDLQRLEDGALLTGPAELREVTRAALERYIITELVTLADLPETAGSGEDEDGRIRAGEVRWGPDIGPDTIPFEAGLDAWVSTTKGCYTGQETIARIETYGEVARKIRRLVAVAASRPAVGPLVLEGVEVGQVTSVTGERDAGGSWHALALVRKPAWPAGTTLTGRDAVAWTVLA